ncbi:phosphoenolpyruvate synthase [Chitinophaga ginsengisegetis]|uniref:Phosphoenolpyruvate synthase n=1 Tax=Chitinophaga ginsengisegetis TaxID=393003 RepID=A0A1T5NBY4_9BACT|nr:phosphoenolpyruvate synthase [Chitinophaga ginsengisegetis]SKC97882.1 phosphoenolpyruvate synthase [Chitinophaga ginsengisegetis]
MNDIIRNFSAIRITDTAIVGGKNASLGEMTVTLTGKGIKVPEGFATTAAAFWMYLDINGIRQSLLQLMQQLDRETFSNLAETGAACRKLILEGTIPAEVEREILRAYNVLGKGAPVAVAVRSSATAEDMPEASFAGQHESYLNIRGEQALLKAVRRCFASLYTDRAIKYREDNGFEHSKVALSVGIQLMVRTNGSCSGVGFTLEPESGFRDVVLISGIWGLGENIVQGTVAPDEFYVFKPTLLEGKQAIIQRKLGDKAKTLCFSDDPNAEESTVNTETLLEDRQRYVLSDPEVLQLARWAMQIEEHYNCPMDIEWARDAVTGELFILQARPETIHTAKKPQQLKIYKLREKGNCLVTGEAIGEKMATGIARVLQSPADIGELQPGDIVVTDNTSPDWDPVLKKVAAIVTNTGGRTSHASIVARELGVPAIVGATDATQKIRDGAAITVSCSEGKIGYVYEGALPFEVIEMDPGNIALPESTEACLIISDPDKAFQLSFYPNDGVGLLRMEFIITHAIGIHPMALVKYDELKDKAAWSAITEKTLLYPDKKKFFVDKLSQGIATIAAAFYPKDVIVRMSDFKTNEYAQLLGGKEFEPLEENPMLGFRGASRYYHPLYKEGFGLECAAIKMVREEMGLTNVKVMIPFCRTVEEGRKVLNVMESFGLRQGENGLEVYVMAEIPSNVLQAAAFADIFDGFSIGSNDLTQLTLGIDRDSALVSDLFSEEDAAARMMISMMITAAKKAGVRIGLCGQAPSDLPDFAAFLVTQGITSVSFNPDALLKGIANIRKAEDEYGINNKNALPVLI